MPSSDPGVCQAAFHLQCSSMSVFFHSACVSLVNDRFNLDGSHFFPVCYSLWRCREIQLESKCTHED